jgi:hypothetical protein
MQYAILCYHDENVTCAWSKEHDDAVMAKLGAVMEKYSRQGKLGPVARLLPTTAATTLRKDREPALVVDGPFAVIAASFQPRREANARRTSRQSSALARLCLSNDE